MANFISSGQFDINGQSVLELGAGSGLPGILSVLLGADFVVLSDYESPVLLENLTRNVKANITPPFLDKVAVEGHIWGEHVSNITKFSPIKAGLTIDIELNSLAS
jgi:EEF1A N-terminal glycine/lysine methyltransferase